VISRSVGREYAFFGLKASPLDTIAEYPMPVAADA
jgi:hypothetical protein